jgi:spermidine synthase
LKPWIELGRDRAEGGGELSLHRRGDELVIRIDNEPLMSSRRHGSEEALARLACDGLGPGARVLIGGLGMGFTLRAALDALAAEATVIVAEIAAAVVAWNRGPLAPLAGHPLDDPRVEVMVADVAAVLAAPGDGFDAILLDVDNGPEGLVRAANAGIYAAAGLARARGALRAGGALAIWAAARHPGFEDRLARAGFDAALHPVRARGRRGAIHTVFVARPRPRGR